MRSLIISILCLLCVPAMVSAALLVNGDMETNTGGPYSGISNWSPRGAWAPHANHPKPNNGSLGLNFGYMSAGGLETVGQKSTEVFQAGMTYTFSSWAHPNDAAGELVYQIGYDDGAGNFVVLASQACDMAGQTDWLPQAGVSYSPVAGGNEIGQSIWVRLGDGVDGQPGLSDVWFDNLKLVAVPEPASLLLIGLAAVGLIRRR